MTRVERGKNRHVFIRGGSVWWIANETENLKQKKQETILKVVTYCKLDSKFSQ